MKLIVVDNPKSGSAVKRRQLKQWFDEAGIEVGEFVAIGDNLARDLKQHIKTGALIAALGGDGTISAVAGLLADSKATLVPLPGGTLNHFTKDLGIEQDLEQAIKKLPKSRSKRLDIASVNGTFFINNSSLGLYPQSLATRERVEDKFGKWPAAVVGAVRALIQFHHYHLTIDQTEYVTPFVFVGNNDYHISEPNSGGRTRLDQGKLGVAIVRSHTRRHLLKVFLLAVIGRLDSAKEFVQLNRSELTIETSRRSLRVSHDGELSRLKSPITYKIHPKSLRVRI